MRSEDGAAAPRFRVSAPGMLPVLVALGLPGWAGSALAQNGVGAPDGAAATRRGEVVIDGRPDESAWAAAQVLSGFVQNEPFNGEPASERTEVRILYDRDALYVAATMFDRDMAALVTGETRRDASLDDTDAILFVFDTFLDRQNGFVFGTTPAGIEYDGQVTREGQGGSGGGGRPGQRTQAGSGGGFNLNWDGSWEVATSRDAAAWHAEFRIPFTTLRYAGSGEQTWGLNISRNIRRRNEQAFWSPVPRQFDLYRVSLAGSLQLEAPMRRPMTATPYVLASTDRDYANATAFRRNGDVGGDIKVGLTSGLTLDLTVNTDFAQVEVDDQQVNLTRFRLFFPEKRPFFLENAGTFSVGTPQAVELFFSRRIGIEDGAAVPILGGVRLTGKVGGVTVGLLDIQTDGVDGGANPNNFSVVRAFRELPNRSRIGAIAVGRVNTDDAGDHNWTYGVDGRLGIGDALSLDGYVARTSTPGLTGRQDAFQVGGSYSTPEWSLGAAFGEVGASFNPEVGFLPRKAYQFRSVRVLRNFRFPDVSWFRELRPHASLRENRGLDGFSETRLIHVDSHFEFSNGAFFQLPALNFNREGLREPFEIADGITVAAGTYNTFEWGFAYNSNLSAPVSVEGRITIGGFLSGSRYGASTEVNSRFGPTLVVGIRSDYNNVNLPEGDFVATLFGLRVAYSFTPRIYLQSLVQYNNQSDTFSSNVRFGWLNTAGTGLFVVYNDVESTVALLTPNEDRWEPLNRAFIVKFTQFFNLAP